MNIKYEDYSDILTKREISFLYKNGSLGEKYPNALEFWDNEKNLPLTPYIVLSSSNKIVHWKCPICKYEWDDKIITRRDAIKCPVCSSRIVKQGCNDFATKFPDLALEWDYDKNDCDYSPSTVAFSSHKKGWWKCRICGNSWFTSFNNRANGQGCKVCGYKIVGNKVIRRSLESRGSLYDNCKDLIEEWDYECNKGIDPHKVTVSSRSKVWWKCKECGFKWIALVNARTGRDSTGCPECKRRQEKSSLQCATESYILNNYNYLLLHEFGCTISATNPLTNKKMPYDNELIIGDSHLIIEVNGDQHYRITNFTVYKAKYNKTTPEEELKMQQYRDKVKMDYVLSLGNYHYLAIPYTAFKDNSYKTLIDNKISEILSLTTQPNIKE